MYEDFTVIDRWTDEPLRVVWKANMVAIATRHADATDIRFSVNGRPVWIAMPNLAWVEQKRRTGKVITDYLAAQTAGRYLKTAIESGYDNGREMYSMTLDEVLEHANAAVKEVGGTMNLPVLPIINEDIQPEVELGRLPLDNQGPVRTAAGEPWSSTEPRNLPPSDTGPKTEPAGRVIP